MLAKGEWEQPTINNTKQLTNYIYSPNIPAVTYIQMAAESIFLGYVN